MNVALLAVPFDSGIRDVRMGAGPHRLLERGLADRLRSDGHTVTVREIAPDTPGLPAEIRMAFALARSLASAVHEAVDSGSFPLILSGNCNSSLGTVAGLERAGTHSEDLGVAWFDAHGDFNTPETTVGGFLDGMGLATLVGHCWTGLAQQIPGFTPVSESNVLLLGARHFDEEEAARVEGSAIRHVRSEMISQELATIRRGTSPADLYVHVDLDVLDPAEGRANQFAVAGGLSARNLKDAIAALGKGARIRAASLTAYDPAADADGRIGAIAFDVAEQIVAIAAST